MKNIITLILLIFLLTAISYSQEDTFGRLYRQHNTIYSVQETMDGGFILAGNNGIIKTNAIGRIEWQNLTDQVAGFYFPRYGTSQVIQDENSTYLYAFIKDLGADPNTGEGIGKQFWIYRYDSDGIQRSANLISEAKNLALYSFQNTFDSGYMALLVVDDDSNAPYLIKFNNNLEIEWQSSFRSSVSFRSAPHFTQTMDSGYVAIGINGQLTKFNAGGDTLWTNFDTQRYCLISELQDSTFIIAGYNLLGRLNKDGSLISQDSIDITYPHDLYVNNAENAIYLTGFSNFS
ncbi:MAG: hypothetical protein KDF60_20410, partial [Calditrichaeota bacterium]|nr:hypothetical protein [Calditrichota bacterium]